MQKLGHLSKTLQSLGLTKEALDVSILIKLAFINEAKIQVSVNAKKILAKLKGLLPSGREADFGTCLMVCLSCKHDIKIASSPQSSIWELHRNLRGEEYEGLGYMNDLLIAAISQVQNNGGVAFSGIGSEMEETMVSRDGQRHTLKSLGRSLDKTPVIIFYLASKKCYYIFDSSQTSLAQKMFMASYNVELPDSVLNNLFSNPYSVVHFEDISSNLPEEYSIKSGFKITANSVQTSIPVSLSYEEDTSYKDPDVEKIKQLDDQSSSLRYQCMNILLDIFPGASAIFILEEILGDTHALEKLSSEEMSKLLEDFIQKFPTLPASKISFDEEFYLYSKDHLYNLWDQLYQISQEKLALQNASASKEFEDRKSYIGQIRGIK